MSGGFTFPSLQLIFFLAGFDSLLLLLIHLLIYFLFTSICFVFIYFSFFSLTAAPWVSISLQSLVIFIQTLMGCFPQKRLVDLGLPVSICSVTVMYQTPEVWAPCEYDSLSIFLYSVRYETVHS